jgi:hypothetical protein
MIWPRRRKKCAPQLPVCQMEGVIVGLLKKSTVSRQLFGPSAIEI